MSVLFSNYFFLQRELETQRRGKLFELKARSHDKVEEWRQHVEPDVDLMPTADIVEV